MLHNNMIELAEYRMTAAQEKLESAKILLDNEKIKDSIGRSYYAIFTAARAILATTATFWIEKGKSLSFSLQGESLSLQHRNTGLTH